MRRATPSEGLRTNTAPTSVKAQPLLSILARIAFSLCAVSAAFLLLHCAASKAFDTREADQSAPPPTVSEQAEKEGREDDGQKRIDTESPLKDPGVKDQDSEAIPEETEDHVSGEAAETPEKQPTRTARDSAPEPAEVLETTVHEREEFESSQRGWADRYRAKLRIDNLSKDIKGKRIQLRFGTTPTPCGQVCDLAEAICISSGEICDISMAFPNEPEFRRRCEWAQSECDSAQTTCRSCHD